MNREKFNVGTYYLKPYACTKEHVKDLKDCGIDFVVCAENDKDALDLFSEYGVGAIVSGVVPSWWGGKTENAGKMHELNNLKLYVDAAETFIPHQAIWGIDCGDEPSATDFEHCGKIIDFVNQNFQNRFAYLNLPANYGINASSTQKETEKQLGTKSYEEYIKSYCKNVKTDYICFDFYPYSASVKAFYENLCTVSDACRKHGRSMWTVLQVNSSLPEESLSENNLRFQAYSAMAYGAECIIWACYCPGWWHHNVLDENGNKTQMYEKLRKVNEEVKNLALEYMKYKVVSTHHRKKESMVGLFKNFQCDNEVIVSELAPKSEGDNAVFIFSASDPYDNNPQKTLCTFSSDAKSIILIGKNGKETIYPQNNLYSITISSNEAILLVCN